MKNNCYTLVLMKTVMETFFTKLMFGKANVLTQNNNQFKDPV